MVDAAPLTNNINFKKYTMLFTIFLATVLTNTTALLFAGSRKSITIFKSKNK